MGNRNLQKYQTADQVVLVCTTSCVCQMLDWTCNHPSQQHYRSSVDGLEIHTRGMRDDDSCNLFLHRSRFG